MESVVERFNRAIDLYKEDKIDEAMEIWGSISREENPEAYAKVQNLLAGIFEKQGQIDKAIECCSKVRREDNSECYAIAQFYLGLFLGTQNKIGDAIIAYKNVHRVDNALVYASAQCNLGVLLRKQNKIDEAIIAYQNVYREDDPKTYAGAQWNLGILWRKRNELDKDKEIEAYNNICRSDNAQVYAKAQLRIGFLRGRNGEIGLARKAYANIIPEDDLEVIKQLHIKILDLMERIFSNTPDMKDVPDYIIKLYEILINVYDNILPLLRVLDDAERNIAHYTRPSTAFKLLPNTNHQDENKRDEISKFRLSTIKGVNDPAEGNILYQFLGCNIQPIEHLATFISCFTFNHDSLNQFRLYGKEDSKEATGVSVVLNGKIFFEQDLNKSISIQTSSVSLINPVEIQQEMPEQEVSSKENSKLVKKQPLYRCIYIDPESDYLTIAGREEVTFYREKNQIMWDDYSKNADARLQEVKKILNDLKNNIDAIFNQNLDEELKQSINEIINEILLQLRYLVKHAAFKEEQECRMVYISPLSNQKIILDTDSGQMYVEYEPSVKESIHKIYLSQGAEKYKDHFRLLLNDERGDKVKSSKNPFKNKE